jgi:hypothetical protein
VSEYSFDGTNDFSGGQNAGFRPDKIADNQLHTGINVTVNDGGVGPRPGFDHQVIKVVTRGGEGARSYQQIFNTGKFQAAFPLPAETDKVFGLVISGITFKVNLTINEAEVIKISSTDRLNQYTKRIYWSIAGRFLALFDYPARPVIIDQDKIRRSDPNRLTSIGTPMPEVPTSRLGAFVQNRLFVANAEAEFGAGDPVGNTATPDAPITFEESLTPSAPYNQQFFSLPCTNQRAIITALGFLQATETASGYGPLFASTVNSLYTYAVNQPRQNWGVESLGQIALFGTGITGQRAYANMNSDLVFRGRDGIYTLSTGSQDARSWKNTPISKEVEPYLANDDQSMLDTVVVAYHKNRVYCSVRPERVYAIDLMGRETPDYRCKGMVVLNMDNRSTLGSRNPPVWEGLWTGVFPMEILTIKDELYIISKDNDNINRVYKVHGDADTYYGTRQPIHSRITTAAYDHNDPFRLKFEHSLDLELYNISGDFRIEGYRRPTHIQEWFSWGEFEYRQDCTSLPCGVPAAPIGFKSLSLGSPKDKMCNPATGVVESGYRKLQVLLDIKGYTWTLGSVKIKATKPESDSDSSELFCKVTKTPGAGCNIVSDWNLSTVCPSREIWHKSTEQSS